jgi:hypothetical protein
MLQACRFWGRAAAGGLLAAAVLLSGICLRAAADDGSAKTDQPRKEQPKADDARKDDARADQHIQKQLDRMRRDLEEMRRSMDQVRRRLPGLFAEEPVEVAEIYKVSDNFLPNFRAAAGHAQDYLQVLADWTAAMRSFNGKRAWGRGEVVALQEQGRLYVLHVRFGEANTPRVPVECWARDRDWFAAVKLHDPVKVTGTVVPTYGPDFVRFRLEDVSPSKP